MENIRFYDKEWEGRQLLDLIIEEFGDKNMRSYSMHITTKLRGKEVLLITGSMFSLFRDVGADILKSAIVSASLIVDTKHLYVNIDLEREGEE